MRRHVHPLVHPLVIQVYLASIMITLAMGAQLAVRPFVNPMMNRLETLGLVATFVTQVCTTHPWGTSTIRSTLRTAPRPSVR
jgi:hypothetical protein